MKSFIAMVCVQGEWVGNALRFATREEAAKYAQDLMSRWTLVYDTRVDESDEPVNHKWEKGRLIRFITLPEFLTPEEIALCTDLWKRRTALTQSYADAVRTQVIEPNLQRINQALGQENDAKFLAYAVEAIMIRSEGGD